LNCPSCGRGLPAGHHDLCPFCGARLSVPVEGALAPELRSLTPPARDKVEPMREIPGAKKRERTWKDEVRERMRDRREKRSDGDLPLFRESEDDVPPAASDEIPPDEPEPSLTAPVDPDERRMTLGDPDEVEAGEDSMVEDSMVDLPLRTPAEPAPRSRSDRPGPSALDLEDDTPAEWSASARPVERPALGLERLQAACLDLAFLGGLWAVVLYFAGRAAGVGAWGLLASWPYLAAYLGGLGLLYAAFFTGSTGQTPGKMVTGLRVVDGNGLPPGFVRALARAALGSLGLLVLGAGLLTLLFDPARRALHDRLFQTRVVKG
jgi:uncharacterized RDD family membrane protein YckC